MQFYTVKDHEKKAPLMPDGERPVEFDEEVGLLHFDKLNWKLTKSSESTWSDDLCDFAECEYRKLLSLKKWYPKLSFVPSKLVDKYWHEHILDTKSYLDDCNAVFGYFVHHYPYFGIYGDDDQSKLQVAFDQTVLLYEQHFGDFPTDKLFGQQSLEASRCEGHSCHAPSTCACRSPGACK